MGGAARGNTDGSGSNPGTSLSPVHHNKQHQHKVHKENISNVSVGGGVGGSTKLKP